MGKDNVFTWGGGGGRNWQMDFGILAAGIGDTI